MMYFKSIALLTLPFFVSAAKLSIKLQPAAYNTKTNETGKLYFTVVAPKGGDSGEVLCRDSSKPVCAEGNFTTDLSLYNKVDFTFAAMDGEEISLVGLEKDFFASHVIAEFFGDVPNCAIDTSNKENIFLDGVKGVGKLNVYGSETANLVESFNEDKSYFLITTCFMYIRLEFAAPTVDQSFSAITLSMPLPSRKMSNMTALQYDYDTNFPSWISAAGFLARNKEDTADSGSGENATGSPAPVSTPAIEQPPTNITTDAPSSLPISSSAPATVAVPTTAAMTAAPVVVAAVPNATAPVTDAPATATPSTAAPVTNAPATAAPVTNAPTPAAPMTAPATAAPATAAPATDAPATAAPATDAPASAAPATDAPISAAPATKAPVAAARKSKSGASRATHITMVALLLAITWTVYLATYF